ncbi:MAG: isoprenylcysteine carboxylmethyltransferase family protein [Aureliella sp.]
MNRISILCYGVLSYVVGLASILYMIGWLGNFAVPLSIDSQPVGAVWTAATINLFVFMVFCIQHSAMARPAFKSWWTKLVPESIERSTYVLFSGVALLAVMLCWQPLGGQIWLVENQPLRCVLHTVYLLGWAILFGSTFALNHFDLFGLRQAWLHFRRIPYTQLQFSTPGPYRWVRHPLYVGWLTLAWATPSMTAAHLTFALATTAYILVAIRWEEKDLVDIHGDLYKDYQVQTPMLIPSIVHAQSNRTEVESLT